MTYTPATLISSCLLAIFLLSSTTTKAQRGNYNFQFYEQKKHYFGITLGYNTSDYKIHRSDDIILNDNFRTVESVTGPGINLGFIHNLKLGKYFDFRSLLIFSSSSRTLEYLPTDELPAIIDTKEFISLSMPFHIRYKSAPYKDKRLFVIAGMKYAYNLSNNSDARNGENLLKMAPMDFSFEVGAGIQMFFPYFIFSPEIKLSHGVGNILIRDQNLGKSSVLESILSRALTISLHFEG